jgi:hypothetical protein
MSGEDGAMSLSSDRKERERDEIARGMGMSREEYDQFSKKLINIGRETERKTENARCAVGCIVAIIVAAAITGKMAGWW